MFIQGKINSISSIHVSRQHSAACKVINELTGRKDHPSIQLKGGSPEKRREHWLNHFKSLLGNQPVLNTEALPLTQIFDELNITTSSFTKHELTKCVRRILEEMRKLNKDAFICFVDFKKAFNFISREKF